MSIPGGADQDPETIKSLQAVYIEVLFAGWHSLVRRDIATYYYI